MICPKCGRPVEENAVICRGCDFILDTEFLGDGILDEEHSLRPGAGGVDPAAFNLADAVILGNIDDDSQSFETSDSGFHLKANLSARLYVSGRSQALMSPDAVPALAASAADVRLTPFEKHVLAFIDGKKPVEVIRKAAGLDEAEVKTALATLADKGVVKVVGRALADFDAGGETAARRAPPRHRMRGSVVGAVALVGDEADRAIEEAFRTQVAIANPLLARGAPAPALPADGDVFQQAGTGVGAGGDSDLPSDIDQFIGLKGTDEIEKQKRLEQRIADDSIDNPTTSSTLRPSAHKGPINRTSGRMARPPIPPPVPRDDSQEGIDASAEASAVERSIVDRSDGFDEFGQPSDVSTAVVPHQFSDSSSSPSVTGARPDRPERLERGRSGVFADISDIDGGALGSVQDLADSRVVPRPKVPGLQAPGGAAARGQNGRKVAPPSAPKAPATPAPSPNLASDLASEGSISASGPLPGDKNLDDPSDRDDSPSIEMERRAASGEVWDNNPGRRPPTNPGLDSSLSALLSEEEEEPTANLPPERAAQVLRRPGAPASGSESFEEPTAAGQPMPPLPLPRVGKQPPGPRVADPAEKPTVRPGLKPVARAAPPPVPSVRASPPPDVSAPPPPSPSPRGRGRGSAMVSLADQAGLAPAVDENSGLHEVNRGPPPGRGAADELFDEDSGLIEPPKTGPAPRVRGRGGASDDSTGDVRRPRLPARAAPRAMESEASAEVGSADASVHDQSRGDETVPPSQAESDLPDDVRDARMASASEASAPDRSVGFASDADASDRDASVRDPSDPDASEPEGSVEMVDSALVIRPAAKATPLQVANRRVVERSTSAPRRPGTAAVEDSSSSMSSAVARSDASDEHEEPQADSDDTLNLDAEEQLRRFNGRMPGQPAGAPHRPGTHVAAGGGAAAIPSGLSQVVNPGDAGGAKPTLENRRKARKLFEEAVKEAAAGRLGAARMNAKLATIYDGENEEYRRQLAEWEARPATVARPPATPTSQSQSQNSSRASDESQAEIKALYDEAQRHEDSGDVDAALEILEQGVERFPNAAAFHNRMGVILALRKRDYENAVQAIQRAIDIDPENLHYKSNLGKIVAKMRRGAS